MATIYTRQNGETGFAMLPSELPANMKPLYDETRKTYEANQVARKALTAALAQSLGDKVPHGKALQVTFRFGQLNLAFVAPKGDKAKASAPVKETLSAWLDANNA